VAKADIPRLPAAPPDNNAMPDSALVTTSGSFSTGNETHIIFECTEVSLATGDAAKNDADPNSTWMQSEPMST